MNTRLCFDENVHHTVSHYVWWEGSGGIFQDKIREKKSLKLAEFSDNFIGFLSVSRNDTWIFRCEKICSCFSTLTSSAMLHADCSDFKVVLMDVFRNISSLVILSTLKFLHSHKANLSHLPLSPSSGGVFFKDFSLILNMHLNTWSPVFSACFQCVCTSVRYYRVRFRTLVDHFFILCALGKS